MKHRKSEAGQAIVLIAFGMIVLIMVMGLAIDGGGLLFLRRDAQNAADAAIKAVFDHFSSSTAFKQFAHRFIKLTLKGRFEILWE